MFKKKGETSKKTKKGRIHHGIEIPCFLRQLINKTNKLLEQGRYYYGGYFN